VAGEAWPRSMIEEGVMSKNGLEITVKLDNAA